MTTPGLDAADEPDPGITAVGPTIAPFQHEMTCTTTASDTGNPVTSPILTTWTLFTETRKGLRLGCQSYGTDGCPLAPCVWFVAHTGLQYNWYGGAYDTKEGYVFCPHTLQLDTPNSRGGRFLKACDLRDGTITS